MLLTGASDTIEWTLSGPGSIDPTTGPATRYTPPATLSASTTATLTATAGALQHPFHIVILPGS